MLASTSWAQQRDVSTRYINGQNWLFVATTLDGTVESFVGLRTNIVEGDNLTTVWYRRVNGAWEAYSWNDQNQGRAIASVKSILQLPNSSDSRWPVLPSTQQAGEPECMEKGMLKSDPMAETVEGMEDPSQFVQVLESAGWRAAWVDVWKHACEHVVVLDMWAVAVEVTEFEIAANSGINAAIEAAFNNTVSQPCGGEECTRLIHGQVTLVSEGDPGSIIAVGVVPDGAGHRFMEASVISPGQVLIHGSIKNTGTQPAVLLLQNGQTIPVGAGQEVALVETNNQCYDQCSRIVGWVHDPGFGPRIPIYSLDNKCYCCCWAGLQPNPPTWLQVLPSCPSQIGFDQDGDPVNPDPNTWQDPDDASPTYHPGAGYCMRSQCPAVDGGPGQQCCYDAAGSLITVGGGAGTPDMVAPCCWWDAWVHHDEDVESYNRCKAAGMLDCYLFHRPPNNGNGSTCNPPNHAHGTNPPSAASCNCP